MDRKDEGLVREALMRHGIDPSLARHVTIGETEADGEPRGLVTIGYIASGQWRETAMVSTTTVDDAVALVCDRDRIAPLLALGVRAMPPTLRPTLPDWVANHPEARRTRRDLARARTLADDAASGRTQPARDEDPPKGNSPF